MECHQPKKDQYYKSACVGWQVVDISQCKKSVDQDSTKE